MTIQTHLLGDRRVGQFVNGKTLDTNATVQEAIDSGYVVGKKELVVSAVSGVVRSMVAGVSRDGNGRKIDEVVSLQPSVRCKLADNCEPVTKDNVEAKIRARVLKEGAIDTSDWSFTVEGATTNMDITSVTTGEAIGEVFIGEAIDFNVANLGDVATGAKIAWTANDETETKTGEILLGACTVTVNRITTAADVLASLTGSTWEGKTVVFTLTNGTAKAIKSATLHAAG